MTKLINKTDKIYIAGHAGLVGSALRQNLNSKGYSNQILRNKNELDLLDQSSTDKFFDLEKPDVVFVAAARVGGIQANNTYRAEFIYQNIQIQNNIIWNAHIHGVKRLVFLGSSCIYPRNAAQPMQEESLLTGPLEFTNRPYALAKIAGLETVNSLYQQYGHKYFSVMPTNLYGPKDNFHPENSHVLPALIRRFHEAKMSDLSEVVVWGSGKPKREFLYSEDCADAIVYLAENLGDKFYSEVSKSESQYFHVNVGSGEEVEIGELAQIIKKVVGYNGKLSFDSSKPDGAPRKLLDCKKLLNLGWRPKTSLVDGIEKVYKWYLENRT